MTRSKRINHSLSFVFLITSLAACAQSRHQNLQRLNDINAIAASTVLLNNQNELLPIKKLAERNIVSINLGFIYQKEFDSLLAKYADVKSIDGTVYTNSSDLNDLEDDLKYFNTIIITVIDQTVLQKKVITFINNLSQRKDVIISFFGKGKNLSAFETIASPLLWQAKINSEAAMVVPQIIFGGIAAQETLKSNYSAKYKTGSGFKTNAVRLKYTVPEDANVNTDDLAEADKIVAQGIAARAMPGCVVLVAKDGKVIYNKAFGFHTYSNTVANKVTDIFDLASVTKIAATTLAVMRLVEKNQLNLDTAIGYYLAKARNTPMEYIPVREVMLHQAGFIPYIPFQDYIKPGDFSRDSSAAYPTKVADNYYIKKGFFNNFMWPTMLNSPIKTRNKYVYSDISMYVMSDIVEHITETPLNQYATNQFYKPLGMHTAGFLPRNRFGKEIIVPTENDTIFRKTLLEGYVHDQGAALKGGVAGHAGLFANCTDLAVYCQMLLNKGIYGGERYFNPQTVETFIAKQSNVSRRGLGFDRWDPDSTKKYPSQLASPQTFGHTGYTGVGVWIDPSRTLIYIFLSNRINPSVSDKLLNMNIRSRIQDVFNKAVDKGKKLSLYNLPGNNNDTKR